MSHLLHLDSSARQIGSSSRALTQFFVDAWRRHHPDGEVTRLDLAADPIDHLGDVRSHYALDQDADRDDPHSMYQLNLSMRRASHLIVGAPMYTYTIPTTLKAWLDRIAILPNFADRQTGAPPLGSKLIVVVTARGGSDAPGTPKAPHDFQTPLLRAVFGALGLGQGLHFVNCEMTLAASDPKLHQFKELGERSLRDAEARLLELAEMPAPLATGGR
jgi:FMN-dependent NADH-azoreductase